MDDLDEEPTSPPGEGELTKRRFTVSEAIAHEARRRGTSNASSEHECLGLRRSGSLNQIVSLDEYANHDEAKRPPCLGLSLSRGGACLVFHGPRDFTSSQTVSVRRIAVQDVEGSPETLPLLIQSDNLAEEPTEVLCGDDVSIFLDRDQLPCGASHAYAQHIVEVQLPHMGEPQLWLYLKFLDKSLEELVVFSHECPDSLELCLARDYGRKWLRVDEALDAEWHVVEDDVCDLSPLQGNC